MSVSFACASFNVINSQSTLPSQLSFSFFTVVTCVTLTNWRVCSNVKFLGCCTCMTRGRERLSIGCIHEPVDLTEESATKAATGSSPVLVMLINDASH